MSETREFAEYCFVIAKQVVLKQGSHAPTFLLQGDKGVSVIVVGGGFPQDADRRWKLCHHLGARMPMNLRRKEVGTLQFVALSVEAWMITRSKADFDVEERPTLAADRVEVLVTSVYEVATGETREWVAEMLRTEGGVLHDLLPRQEDGEGVLVSNVPMDMFMAGWRGEPLQEPQLVPPWLEEERGE